MSNKSLCFRKVLELDYSVEWYMKFARDNDFANADLVQTAVEFLSFELLVRVAHISCNIMIARC